MKGQRRLPAGAQFISVGELIADPHPWRLLMGESDDTVSAAGAPRAAEFVQPGMYGSASLLGAPSGMLVLVVEIPESER